MPKNDTKLDQSNEMPDIVKLQSDANDDLDKDESKVKLLLFVVGSSVEVQLGKIPLKVQIR